MCSVDGCNSFRRNAKRFKLPKDPEERLEWIQFVLDVNGQRLKESTWTDITICSEHFTNDCFVNKSPTGRLKPGSVPSLSYSVFKVTIFHECIFSLDATNYAD
uniref:THAP domain-containing protein 1 n=1 Tax=Stegastes partitus TaxID=144197 RepID=A0A3B4ZVT5_9TELE